MPTIINYTTAELDTDVVSHLQKLQTIQHDLSTEFIEASESRVASGTGEHVRELLRLRDNAESGLLAVLGIDADIK